MVCGSFILCLIIKIYCITDYVVWMENSNPGTDINPNVMFNYNIETTFDVLIKCNDSQNHASIERLEVDIIDNDRVVFTNLPGIIIYMI